MDRNRPEALEAAVEEYPADGVRATNAIDLARGERPFCVRPLAPDAVRALYAERLVRDFPPDEVKPLSRIEAALTRGRYACYGAIDGASILAYAFFAVLGRVALFDYYAVDAALRGRGVGSRFIRALIEGPLREMDCVLLEVDDPDFAADAAERAVCARRLRFYRRNSLTDTGVTAVVYGVHFRILALPIGKKRAPEAIRGIYADLYRAILPPALYAREVKISPENPGEGRA